MTLNFKRQPESSDPVDQYRRQVMTFSRLYLLSPGLRRNTKDLPNEEGIRQRLVLARPDSGALVAWYGDAVKDGKLDPQDISILPSKETP